jgi:hypothetical protein
MAIVGQMYLEWGQPVEVLAQWRGAKLPPAQLVGNAVVLCEPLARGPVRNVLIRRNDGALVVRPFRGLRRADAHLALRPRAG